MAKFAKAWVGFNLGDWCDRIDVRDFIQKNYTPYEGDETFLSAPTERTRRLMVLEEQYISAAISSLNQPRRFKSKTVTSSSVKPH
jgi:pyruvate-formate lyase